jgi:hypothetical protein
VDGQAPEPNQVLAPHQTVVFELGSQRSRLPRDHLDPGPALVPDHCAKRERHLGRHESTAPTAQALLTVRSGLTGGAVNAIAILFMDMVYKVVATKLNNW